MDQLLGGLFGGQDDDDDNRRRSRADDFISRYEQGPPHEGISPDEVFHNYRQVSQHLSPEQYEQAAEQAFARMSPQERMQFAQMLQQRAGGGMGGRDFQLDDPRQLAGLTSRFRQQNQGGDLLSMFGMGGGGGRNSGGGLGDMLDNPIAKAALGGIAAMAMKRMMDR